MKISKDSLPSEYSGIFTGGQYVCRACLLDGESLEGIPMDLIPPGCARCRHKARLQYREIFRTNLATDVKDFIQGNRDELSLHDPATKLKATLEILIDRVADLEFVSLNSRP
jgi:hypothetical protein